MEYNNSIVALISAEIGLKVVLIDDNYVFDDKTIKSLISNNFDLTILIINKLRIYLNKINRINFIKKNNFKLIEYFNNLYNFGICSNYLEFENFQSHLVYSSYLSEIKIMEKHLFNLRFLLKDLI